jgi:Fe-S-cluster containining protein
LWEERNRYDILQWVDEVLPGVYDIWIDPRTGDDVGSCPWLQQSPQQGRYVCRIQDVKPESCRKYPFTKDHAGKTGCRGFE